jgi:hypothetical protein
VLTLPHRRSKTLIVALISVAVPAALTVVAIAGDLAGASSQSAAAAESGRVAVRQAAAAAGASTNASQLPTAAPSVQSTPGMRLLVAAAVAGESTAYQGVEIIARSTMTGTSTVLSTVWHTSGGQTMTQTTEAASPSAGAEQLSYDPYQDLPEGVFGVTKPLVTLLASHYNAVLAGTGSVAGRTATIVALKRTNGVLAARFWLDTQTGLPLRREDYDTNSQVITEATFIQVKFGQPLAAKPAGTAPSGTGWDGVAVPAVLAAELRTKGWPIPAVLPGGLSLYAAAVSNEQNGAVDLSYADGLYEVSLFVQKGVLAPKLAGWEASKINGRPVFISARGVTWSGKGYVYTVLSDASPEVVTQAVAALPHDTPPGFWTRLGHGLKKLAHVVDPFR